METTITWEVKVKNTPLLIKKCSHCDSDRFYCSDKFRMNAQKKNIDVWLIYRCVKCDNTCNLTLLSRSKPDLIDKTLFHSFSMNDKNTAWKYAFSTEMERKNNLRLDYGSVEYEVIPNTSLEDLLNLSNEVIKIHIKYEFEFDFKLSSLIRRCFSLSANQVKRMFEDGIITISGNKPPQKHKVKDGDMILIQREGLSKSINRSIHDIR
ncbi:DUF1062 domain-containing protein [Bacteroides intestinalis]|jgi:hypothetical protein|uniref:DUF1062 domain-containing protein n=1 Tax=Bacteroides intestinalis TaxID=329854 RepID=A0AAQ0RQ08_9BACE|nr:DUF1062 domain-containing protein [Bacteroides intestinalis]QDO69006.1 DUF1062 domain-containing protein [Bacteroides intestinalis]RGT44303.1 DUF1062 domain-containing protein [Bacteroides intestinalis]RGX84160.1 DUF1062 domain-containing protein [Bacteroides intestinalis]UCB37233.1 DUF1062 domain-containing protein [Bacteroides intestinalis]UCB41476.1 DUF1062 domain-containing protein [Bacteroides intestinalis]